MYARNIEITPRGVTYDLCTRRMLPLSRKSPAYSAFTTRCPLPACILLGVGPEVIKTGLEAMPSVAGRFEVLDTSNRPLPSYWTTAHAGQPGEYAADGARVRARPRDYGVWLRRRPRQGQTAHHGRDRRKALLLCGDHVGQPAHGRPMKIIGRSRRASNGLRIRLHRKPARGHTLRHPQRPVRRHHRAGGQGHETYQEINGVKYPFDEKVVVASLLSTDE